MRPDTLYITVPCYNEEEILTETSQRLVERLISLMERGLNSRDSRVLLVNDDSRDSIWQIIRALHEKSPPFSEIDLSRNQEDANHL